MIARTTDIIYYQNSIYMLVSGNKGSFEKYKNAILNDFYANWRKISMF